jgi:hypothetical protein
MIMEEKIVNNSVVVGIVGAIISYFTPLFPMICLLLAAITLDTVTAIIRDIRSASIDPKLSSFGKFMMRCRVIKSNRLRRTGLKAVFYTLFLMLMYAAEMIIITKFVYISNFITFIFFFAEIKSIAENIDLALGTDIFTSTVQKIRKIFENKVAKAISDEEKDCTNQN